MAMKLMGYKLSRFGYRLSVVVCRFAIPNTGRLDNIDRLVLLIFAAGRPYNSMNGDEMDGLD